MGNEQNATPNQPSLLDRIHLFREFAKSAGWSDVAEWLTKHADEPCPAAIAEFMGGVQWICPVCRTERADYEGDQMHLIACPNCGEYRTPIPAPANPLPSEASRTDAVKEVIALVKRHDKCGRGQAGICRLEGEGRQCMTADDLRPVVAALADAERESVHYKDELAAATKRERALEERAVDYERKLAVVQGHYSALESQNFDLTHQLAAAEKRAKDATIAKNLSSQVRDRTGVQLIEANNQIAALTRKLATAREGIAKATTCGHRAGCYHAPPCTHIEILRETIAAIDAPAGEGAPIPPGGKCPECGGVTYGTREVHGQSQTCRYCGGSVERK